jgi:hypothetical protein
MQRSCALILLVLAMPWGASSQNGAIATYRAGSEPACDTSHRGQTIVTLGSSGQPDLLRVCLRDGAGRFYWMTPEGQDQNTYASSPTAGGCPIFPDDNVWNSKIDQLPVDPGSAAIIATYAAGRLGTVPAFTLNVADAKTPAGSVNFLLGSAESDHGKYPITEEMKVEGFPPPVIAQGKFAGDAHLIVLRTDECKLYEIFAVGRQGPIFTGGTGAIYDLRSNTLRPDGWTSADAAGLPIWPGVLTWAELYGNGEIRHMVRFTVNRTRNVYIWPARHQASRSGDAALPPMGSRWRLKASVDEAVCRNAEHSGQQYPPEMRRLIRGLKHYGMILSDNGAAIRISTDADTRWGNGSPGTPEYEFNGWTHCLTGNDFEVVNSSLLMVNPNSAAVVH